MNAIPSSIVLLGRRFVTARPIEPERPAHLAAGAEELPLPRHRGVVVPLGSIRRHHVERCRFHRTSAELRSGAARSRGEGSTRGSPRYSGVRISAVVVRLRLSEHVARDPAQCWCLPSCWSRVRISSPAPFAPLGRDGGETRFGGRTVRLAASDAWERISSRQTRTGALHFARSRSHVPRETVVGRIRAQGRCRPSRLS